MFGDFDDDRSLFKGNILELACRNRKTMMSSLGITVNQDTPTGYLVKEAYSIAATPTFLVPTEMLQGCEGSCRALVLTKKKEICLKHLCEYVIP
jgi:hypothetical protein